MKIKEQLKVHDQRSSESQTEVSVLKAKINSLEKQLNISKNQESMIRVT